MVGPPEQNLDARARTMDPPLTSQMQAVGRDLNTVLARFHAVSRQIPSVVTQEDGTLEAVPCSVIESWEVRLDECKLDKQAVVQRCSREKKEVVDAAMQHIAEINARVTRFERGYLTQVIRTVDAIDTCTKAELVQQLSALVSQRLVLPFSEEELEAARCEWVSLVVV